MPAAQAADGPICTDRPTKANATCTVPMGRVQVEATALGWSLTKADGSSAKLLTAGQTTAKIGLSGRSDLQVTLTPFVRADIDGESLSGFGDTLVRYKQRLTDDAARTQIGIIPWVKLPSAEDGLGNGKVEGGVALPISLPVGRASLTFGPEVDLLVDGDGRGRHLAIVNLVNLAIPAAPRLTVVAEVWSNFNFDPGGTVKQVSADAALTYALSNAVQLDVGANLGLTSETPHIELYGGVSILF